MPEDEIKKEEADLERTSDLGVIEYFEALRYVERLEQKLNYMRTIELPMLHNKFLESKAAHLRVKHGVTESIFKAPKTL